MTPRFRIVAKSIIEDSAIFTKLLLLTQQAEDGVPAAVVVPEDEDEEGEDR